MKVEQYHGNEDLLASNGATTTIPPNARVKINGVPRGYEVPCAPSPEQLVLRHERDKELQAAMAAVIVKVFADDPEARDVMVAIIKPPGIAEKNNIAIARATKLTVAQVEAAKARIKYRIRKSKNPLVHEIRQMLKGGQK
ncbi:MULTISPECIES: hypothetical protein [Hyphomicrobiales]|uniref:Uncharacterized protein n=2 Tax=Brucella/Ochrobactrum group TaxID=2826938 RepID=A6X845_BRUA4|nr:MULTISPECIES: hypothetical protein [Hyphomicrobiales]AIH15751.1 hypothetical protein [Ochrobactrum sp. SJY1]ABS17399.1 hypothetical protein Oant_4813 [Brucella anthropi ATCC 49188]KAB2730999.1 hypothetical protein F9K90_19760 [Brucella anthropi]QQC28794.1 hypothetical protein I6H96_24420 [Brucella anthropi]CDN96360.1 hypothetical protein BN949_05537 [Agrobacterium tumefaciens]